jgi:hypothetical protein
MHRALRMAVLLGAVSIVAGCSSRGPAETALNSAEQALEGAKADLEAYVPDQYAALRAELTEARAKFDQGDYKAAMTMAQGLMPKIPEATTAAGQMKEEMGRMWGELSSSVPTTIASLKTRVDELAKMRKLPAGLTAEGVEQGQSDLMAIEQQWSQAMAAHESGRVAEAVQTASAAKAAADSLAVKLALLAPAS